MRALSEIVQQPRLFESKRKTRERDFPINEMYKLYSSEQDKKTRHYHNVNNYNQWLRSKRIKHSDTNWKIFRRCRLYIGTDDIGKFCIRLAPIKDIDTLFYMLSISKDKFNRKEPIGAFIYGSIKTVSTPKI